VVLVLTSCGDGGKWTEEDGALLGGGGGVGHTANPITGDLPLGPLAPDLAREAIPRWCFTHSGCFLASEVTIVVGLLSLDGPLECWDPLFIHVIQYLVICILNNLVQYDKESMLVQ
jgi:hypothetical protein